LPRHDQIAAAGRRHKEGIAAAHGRKRNASRPGLLAEEGARLSALAAAPNEDAAILSRRAA